MPKSDGLITFATVRTLGLKFPGTEAGTTYGSPALLVNGQMFACMAINKSVEPDTLAVRVPFDQRDGHGRLGVSDPVRTQLPLLHVPMEREFVGKIALKTTLSNDRPQAPDEGSHS